MHPVKNCVINGCEFIENFIFQPIKNCRVYQIAQAALKNAVDFILYILSKVRHYCFNSSSSTKKANKVLELAKGTINPPDVRAGNDSGFMPRDKRNQIELKYKEVREKNLSGRQLGEAIATAYADVYHPLPPSIFERNYPNTQQGDTILFKIQSRDLLTPNERAAFTDHLFSTTPCPYKTRILGLHGQDLSYEDKDIVTVHHLTETQNSSSFYQGRTEKGW